MCLCEPPNIKTGQTGSISIFLPYWLICAIFSGWGFLGMLNAMVKFKMAARSLPVIDWFEPCSQEGGFSGFGTCRLCSKCFHFLLFSQTESTIIFLPVIDWLVPLSHLKLNHFVHHSEKLLSCENGTNQSITGGKMLALPFWRTKQEVTTFWVSP